MTRLLIVDDSPLMRRLLTEIFEEADFEIEVARDAAEALVALARFKPDVITLDINMPGMDGLACLDQIMIERPTPVVMVSSLTAAGADETLEALSLGAIDFITKPRGPLSLEIEGIVADLVAKVRNAASARLPRSARLIERMRLRTVSNTTKVRTSVAQVATPKHMAHRPKGASLSDQRMSGIEVVLVGVSTGGPPALGALLQPLPQDFPWPIVVAQHMPASFTGSLAKRLNKSCALKVVEVSRPVPLEPGTVYIGRGDADLILSRRSRRPHAMAAPVQSDRLWHPSADRLVESARTVFAAPAIVGLLMTGMGYDGAEALAALRRDGGHVIAQDEESSVVWGMPGALVAVQGADLVLPLDQVAAQLIAWSRP